MLKVDYKKQLNQLYSAPADRFVIIDVPEMAYFMVDGSGDPNVAAAYMEAIEALYAVSYTLKFHCKNALRRDYVVPPLEAVWWSDDMGDFAAGRKERWQWTLMIMVPDFIGPDLAANAIGMAQARKPLPGSARIRYARLAEGRCVQTLHIGSYDDEGPTLARLHTEFLPEHRLVEAGHHHEIYLGDPRRAAPDKLRTILRQPVRSAPDPTAEQPQT